MDTQQERRLEVEAPFSVPEEAPGRPMSVSREVWHIAWPAVLMFCLMTTNSFLDRAFVGSLGRDALAAVGVGGQVMFLLGSLAMAIGVGTTALVARFTGAQEPDQATRATGQSTALAAWMGIFGMALIYVLMGPLLGALGLEAGAQKQCRGFLQMALLGTLPMFAGGALSSAFRGLGDTRTPLKAMICANVVHITGDIVLMLGNRPVAHLGEWMVKHHALAPVGAGLTHLEWAGLGLPGGGIAISASGFVSLCVYLVFLRRSSISHALRATHLRLTSEWAVRVLRIGIPAGLAAFLRTSSGMAFTAILARTAEKTAAVAALPIGLTAESIAFMPGLGFSMAASALVGQALGARRPEHAQRCGSTAAWQAIGIMTVMGAVFYLAAEPFARFFTNDPMVIGVAVSYLRINAISEPGLAIGMVLTGALQGAGDTTRPTVVTAITTWCVRVPLAYFLALHLSMNARGAWIAMASTTVLGAILTLMLWRDGRWKRTRV